MGAHHQHNDDLSGRLSIAFWLNVGFALMEVAGGLYSNSVSILSDAMHDAGDSLVLAMSWYLQRVSTRRADSTFTFGYRRFSLAGALINSIVLIVGCVWIIREGIGRIQNPEPTLPGFMMIMAVLGIVVNGYVARLVSRGNSINERVISLHHIEDVLGWVAILIGAACMYFWKIWWIDGVLSLGIAGYILYNVIINTRSVMRIILQATPEEVKPTIIKQTLKGIPGLEEVHDIHVWSLDGSYNLISLHAVANPMLGQQELSALKDAIRTRLALLPLHHITIETEPRGYPCPFRQEHEEH